MQKIMSVVPCVGQKPHCDAGRTSSATVWSLYSRILAKIFPAIFVFTSTPPWEICSRGTLSGPGDFHGFILFTAFRNSTYVGGIDIQLLVECWGYSSQQVSSRCRGSVQ